ncbi:S-adenosyl methyltransferase [Nocardiopsis sp. Huas11]|uniref:SAM-dependent methyltransferase n=1 Tax=Nocardiopsis sp. Huas11 TaxID=2183912 RepID=UPI000EAC4A1A|nr:SAM-dependent methyltransferase [Nocardiopsis sp. Huas11]RKS08130.1 S-adenosyl methyltransferase [Nocardiopsis sp. Huas11]
MTDSPQSRPPVGVDTTTAHSARVWNYWLDGKDNYPVDRELGDLIAASRPSIVTDARAGRGFLTRVVTHMAREEGIRQFLDIGTGLPTNNNTHEVAQAVAPEAHVVYVDNDPMVLAHARALLNSTEEGATAFVDADLRDTDKVLEAARELLDFDRPIGVTILGTLGHITEYEAAREIVDAYMAACPSGSFLAIGDHVMPEDPAAAEALRQWNEGAALPYRSHTTEEFTAYFEGLKLLDPGAVPATRWRTGEPEVGTIPHTDMHVAAARKS